MLSQEALQEFKMLWVKEFGEEISDEQATEQAINLLVLFGAIYKPIKNEWLMTPQEENSV